MRAAAYIRNDDDGTRLVEDCVAAIRNGNNLIIFPEGTRTSGDGSITLKRGAANIAVRARRNVTPVLIRCQPVMLAKGVKWWRLPPRPSFFNIEVKEDIDIHPLVAEAGSEVLAARHLTEHLQTFLPRNAAAMQSFEDEIKQLVIEALQLEDITPADIDSDAPLFVEGLGLDSIDALELGVAIQKRYGIILSASSEENRRHFASIRALAGMIENNRKHEGEIK